MSASGSGTNSGGLQSSAGLVQYFDQQDNRSITIDPKTVMAVAMFAAIGLMSVHAVVPVA